MKYQFYLKAEIIKASIYHITEKSIKNIGGSEEPILAYFLIFPVFLNIQFLFLFCLFLGAKNERPVIKPGTIFM